MGPGLWPVMEEAKIQEREAGRERKREQRGECKEENKSSVN